MSSSEVPTENNEQKKEMDPSNLKVDVSDAVKIRTVKVSNISLDVSEAEIKEFFSFSGNIQHTELQRESEKSQVAYVTFKNAQGAHTASLLSGSCLRDLPITVTPVDNYLLPPDVSSPNMESKSSTPDTTGRRAEDVVSSMLAKGFILGKDALNRAKSFDERHHLISNASATVASIDQKMGLREKIGTGTAVVNEKVKEIDEQYQVSEKTRLAFAAAEEKATMASSAILNNQYVSTGASWVSGALNKVARAAEAVSLMTMEKVEKAEEQKKEAVFKERTGVVNDFSQLHLDGSPLEQSPVAPPESSTDNKPKSDSSTDDSKPVSENSTDSKPESK